MPPMTRRRSTWSRPAWVSVAITAVPASRTVTAPASLASQESLVAEIILGAGVAEGFEGGEQHGVVQRRVDLAGERPQDDEPDVLVRKLAC